MKANSDRKTEQGNQEEDGIGTGTKRKSGKSRGEGLDLVEELQDHLQQRIAAKAQGSQEQPYCAVAAIKQRGRENWNCNKPLREDGRSAAVGECFFFMESEFSLCC